MSDGVAQWVGSLGSVLQMSVTLAIMSGKAEVSGVSPSGQKEMQTSCMQ